MEKKSDLFTPDNNYNSNVVWGWWGVSSDGAYLLYAHGYLEAAKRLVRPMAKGKGYNDMVAFPIFFLFRHYLELTLKACILMKRNIKRMTEGLRVEKLKYIHDLEPLLSELKKLFEPKEEFLPKQVQEKIRLIGDFDTKSERFRYPFDKNGNPLINDQMWIGMKNTKKTIEDIGFCLDGLVEKIGFDEELTKGWYTDFL